MANPAAIAIFLQETHARLFLSVSSNRGGSARRCPDTRTGDLFGGALALKP